MSLAQQEGTSATHRHYDSYDWRNNRIARLLPSGTRLSSVSSAEHASAEPFPVVWELSDERAEELIFFLSLSAKQLYSAVRTFSSVLSDFRIWRPSDSGSSPQFRLSQVSQKSAIYDFWFHFLLIIWINTLISKIKLSIFLKKKQLKISIFNSFREI